MAIPRQTNITLRQGKGGHIVVGGDERTRKEYDDILRLTGEMVADWAALDEMLALVLMHLAECTEDTARIIYYSPSAFSGRLEIIQNLLRHNMPSGPERDVLGALLTKLDQLHKTRNSIIHSQIVLDYDASGKETKYRVERATYRPARSEPESRFKAQANGLLQHMKVLSAIWQCLHLITERTLFTPVQARNVRNWISKVFKSS